MVSKAAAAHCDEVLLDLEDAVPLGQKLNARDGAVRWLRELDWGLRTRAVRINSLDSEFWHDDLVQIVLALPTELDVVVLPKVRRAEDVRMVDRILEYLERKVRRPQPIGLEVLIEDTLSLVNVAEIATSSPRLEALIFGHGDLAISQGAQLERLDELQACGFDAWSYARSRILVAARASSLDALDSPFAAFHDLAGYERESFRSCALGYCGKWAIHPGQLDIANRIFAPSEAEINRARRISDLAVIEAEGAGSGAFEFEGQMVDAVGLQLAQRVVARANEIAARVTGG